MKKISIKATLPVTFMREDKQFVAYSPVLDLSTSGHTFELARRRFEQAVDIFIDECIELGTLSQVLEDLGWKKVKKEWKPPVVIAQDSYAFSIPANI